MEPIIEPKKENKTTIIQNFRANKINKKRIGRKGKMKRRRFRTNRYNYGLIRSLNNIANSNQAMQRMRLKSMYSNYSKSLKTYLYGLLNPEKAVIQKLAIKMPSHVPLPTQTLHIQNDFTAAPNNKGKCLIIWRPNYLTCDKVEASRVSNNLNKKTMELWGGDIQQLSETGVNQAYYSQLTFNSSNDLDGETEMTGLNEFKTFKQIHLPISKYRLIGAKLVIRYTGRADEESGTITYGQYNGTLAPIMGGQPLFTAKIASGTISAHAGQLWFSDTSTEAGKFSKFDNIRVLPYATTEDIKKGKKYSFYYFPMDCKASQFEHAGGYGNTDGTNINWKFQATNDAFTTVYVSKYQPGHRVQSSLVNSGTVDVVSDYQTTYEDTVNQTDFYEDRPEITNPSYVIAFNNMEPLKDSITLSVYEVYEVIADEELNMLGGGISANVSASLSENDFDFGSYQSAKTKLMQAKAGKADLSLSSVVNDIVNQSLQKSSEIITNKAHDIASRFTNTAKKIFKAGFK